MTSGQEMKIAIQSVIKEMMDRVMHMIDVNHYSSLATIKIPHF